MDRPITTLFMLMSADGKISTGASDDLDFDRDLPPKVFISIMRSNRRLTCGLSIPEGYRKRWVSITSRFHQRRPSHL